MIRYADAMVEQSAAIPYRVDDAGGVEVLLVTSKSRRRWILPKGRVPFNMRPQFSAAREALEEGGVVGVASNVPVADYEQDKVGAAGKVATVRVLAYPLEVTTEIQVWAEMHVRKRRWLSLKKAIAKVTDPRIRRVLRAFRDQRGC